MIKGVIFDIDGVLIDSEALHSRVLTQAIEEVLNKEITIQTSQLIGLTLEDTFSALGVSEKETGPVAQRALQLYLEKVNCCLVRTGVRQLWEALQQQKIPFGCVSSAEMAICRGNIGVLKSSSREVPIVSSDCVTQSKPAPLPYLKMLEILNLKADEVIVVEDSDTGIESAVRAGIENVYAWPHQLSYTQSYTRAKRVINSLAEIDFFKQVLESMNQALDYVSF